LRIDIKSLILPELEAEILLLNQPKYRAAQIYKWLQSGVGGFDQMSNLPLPLRKLLSEHFEIYTCEVERKLVSSIDGTVKYLMRLRDGEFIECVLMRYKHGLSLCISTQVGCRMGCGFCASGLDGLKRNLTASEMLAQIQTAYRDIGERISNIVMMGMGEPLDNFRNVLRFLELAGQPDGVGIGMRHISLSTCGLVDIIYLLMQRKLQLTLSVSLHAPNDAIRGKIMPINKKWNVDVLLKACRDYVNTTGRRISFEYSMIRDLNDSPECAVELSAKLKGMLCHVNLIPVNRVEEHGFSASSGQRLREFKDILEKSGLNVTVRRTLGGDINASCGQLRKAHHKM